MCCMSDLSTYLTRHKLSQRTFAERIGVDPSIVSRLVRREIKPSLELAVTIQRETKGKIKAESWVEGVKQ